MTIRRLLDYWSVILVFGLFFGILSFSITRNVTYTVLRSRATDTKAEVSKLDTAIVGLLADGGATPRQFFLPHQFTLVARQIGIHQALQPIDAAVEVYSRAFRALLEHGRNAATVLASSPEDAPMASVLNGAIVSGLGTGYVNDFNDSWGRPYRFYPTLWPEGPKLLDYSGAPMCIWSTGADGISQTDASGRADDIANLDVEEKWRAAYEAMPFWKKFAAAFF